MNQKSAFKADFFISIDTCYEYGKTAIIDKKFANKKVLDKWTKT